jgi:hypothetical protein
MPTRFSHVKNHPVNVVINNWELKIEKQWKCYVNREQVGIMYKLKWGYIGVKNNGNFTCWHMGSWQKITACIANSLVDRVGGGYTRP